ncbi:aminoalkylphosphonic acid N-acetyltransferase [Bremerella volcania]|uniref:Aminoalkylphosphonic acid N-acetyltransferase n=1 Tax=Bremerella volcania TaxID=2527984 RepID=A0A518C6U8_9BACT|nr:GNAT family N-acetyltransferase [Bremerella volcania]QDU74947.1 aminoalkylphosphonic acid N-acetyltransferase [Bremerella volcania]
MPAFSGEIIRIDLNDLRHAEALVHLLDQYSQDPMGSDAPLPPEVHENLIPRLRQVDQFRGLLAQFEGRFVGLANCFLGFSTFKARPLINIHDLAVAPEARGQGVGSALLQAVDQLAKEEACAFVTLEVRADNRARQLYLRHGFVEGNPATDAMSFFKKPVVS